MASTTVVDTQIAPRAALVHDSKRGSWKPASVRPGYINISGGFNKQLLPAASIQIKLDNTLHTFVDLDKNAQWFLKGVGGLGTRKDDLKPVRVLGELRDKFSVACGDSADTAVADKAADDDPMNALDDLPQSPSKAKPKEKKRPAQSKTQDLTMPTRPECVGCDDAGTITVCVYRKSGRFDITKGGRCHSMKSGLYLRTDFINWLLAYGADELHYQGVKRPLREPSQKHRRTCTAVADLSLSWDFHEFAWEAEFTAGTFMGTIKRIKLTDLGPHWETLKNMHLSAGYRNSNPVVQRKAVAKEFITQWCAAISRAEGTSFEERWGLRGAGDVDTAVADGTHVDSADTAVADKAADDDAIASENELDASVDD